MIREMFAARGLAIEGLPPIHFEVAPGESLAVSGPSGSGKTRLLRALADLDPASGQVFLEGVERRSVAAPDWRRKVGLLSAEPRFWAPTVAGHFPAPPSEEQLREFGLPPESLGSEPGRLSTGERARLAILRLLLREPEVLLLDEPTANLDAANRELVVRFLSRFRRERQAAVIWASHAAPEVAAAERVLLLPEATVTARR